jgi:diphthine synthase
MLYIIGLGLNSQGISLEGFDIVKRCKKVYLENYTVDFPYSFEELCDVFVGKKIVPLNREEVESFKFIDESEKGDVALLVYGSPLIATTHVAIIDEAIKSGIKTKVINGTSVLDGVARTGLQLYKFGKIASMPEWKPEKDYTPDSFMEIVKDNLKINAHSLILIDIGLGCRDALKQLEKAAETNDVKLDKLVLCQSLGTKYEKIFYRTINELKEFTGVRKPYCFVIPANLHFVEREILDGFEERD